MPLLAYLITKEAADVLIPLLLVIVGACAMYLAVPDGDNENAKRNKDKRPGELPRGMSCPLCKKWLKPGEDHTH
jgi:hypothetical protein